MSDTQLAATRRMLQAPLRPMLTGDVRFIVCPACTKTLQERNWERHRTACQRDWPRRWASPVPEHVE